MKIKYLESYSSDLTDGLVSELELHVFGLEHLLLLPDQVVHRLRQDAVKVLLRQPFKTNANGEATLQLRQEF